MQFTGSAAIALIGGSLAPWSYYGGDLQGLGYASGIDLNQGELSVLIGAVAVFMLTRVAKRGRPHDSGGIAALGLLACVVVAVFGVRIYDGNSTFAWGFWISLAGAGSLLVGGLILLGAQEDALPPPD